MKSQGNEPTTFSSPQAQENVEEIGGTSTRGDAFVDGGFRKWNKPERFEKHVGGIKSAHNLANEKYVNLKDGKNKSIVNMFEKASEVIKSEYYIHLNASLTCLRLILGQGLAFRGHDESDESYNRGYFIELFKCLGEKVKEVGDHTLENASGNCQMTSPPIQKDIINCCAKETTKLIVEELGDDYFAILTNELSDVSQKEQLALVLHFDDRDSGKVMERFLGIVPVGDTTALSLKDAIMSLLVEHLLSPSMIRGKGYDGASNMKGEINGLKTFIMNDTPRAYYIHCFAHQLQLTLVVVAKRNDSCGWLFEILANLLNVVGVSCKRRGPEILVGDLITSVFYTNDLCIALQRKEQDIVNTMELVTFTKSVLQKMREQGWETLLNKEDHDALSKKPTNLHHFRVEIFLGVIDLHLQELDNRFDEISMELLTCMACLNPKDNFSYFDK
ncbi:zinc finger MYM-type protein 1-like [Chenopodium quinoa]|uniref:zinc finger MYM-type protein 1-like n=1 Tax=Chenopodium quinoa TaxID=63459 RepID=UPI000B7794D9|nr:zinc finger MYM-type protein 1-like [Chenopodium quinoa]